MKKILYSVVLLFCLQLNSGIYAQPFKKDVRTVLFLGNSITYAGGYITDIEAYVRSHYPGQDIKFINVGLPSETVSGLSEPGHADGKFPRPDLHERLHRVLNQIKPDLIFACYGMNDGIYKVFDRDRFQKFKDGMNWLHTTLAETGARIVFLTPPVFDELRGGHEGYSQVLDHYSDWLLKQKRRQKWEVADLHYPMKKYLKAHRKVDAAFVLDGFSLANDGIHPGDAGHWLMAKQLLLYLGEKEVRKSANIKQALADIPNGEQILKLVGERQAIMKDAWLTSIGHKRPMQTGLPLWEAQEKASQIELQLKALLPVSEKTDK